KGIDPVEQSQLVREQVQSDREADQLRLAAEREAELLKIEADRQEAVHQQQLRLQALAEKTARMTVRSLFDQWQRLELVQRADKGSEAERSFERDVFPLIGNVAAADVSKAHIQEIVDTIKSRATPTQNMVRTAKKTLADMRQMFGFALDRDYVDADPTARVKKARIGADVERDRVLSEAEMILLFQKLPKAGLAATSQLALLIQLTTPARIGEVLAARWEHVDFERRNLTLPETKNGKRHEIWLSDFALRQLKSLHENTGLTPWLFPATQPKKDQPDFADHVCVKTVTKQVGDRQRPGDLPMSGRSKDVDALVLPGGKWTPHDLRRTAATTMAELGALPDVVEKCLNHTEVGKVKRIYQRAQYEGPMREAWKLLGSRLTLLQDMAHGRVTNVVPMKRGR
ncbi:MAG: site-specific integrase, partial [Candidatus Saccharibacteria bacterium]|nr:site-specific integrase [Rhodoferax sp.]